MNILKCLASDHRDLERLLKKLDATTERGAKIREKLFLQFKNLLVAHAKSEETVLYDALKESGGHDIKENTLEAFEEHHIATVLLKELSALDKTDERWGAKLSVLKELLEQHIEEEESRVFASARKLFEPNQLDEMGADFLLLKDAHLSKIGLPVRLGYKVSRRIAG